MWVSAIRASSILYNYLLSIDKKINFFIPANVCPIVLATLKKANMSYTLVDIEPENLCLDRVLTESLLKNENAEFGVLYIRTFGNVENVDPWFASLKHRYPNIHLIDDRCLCKPELNADCLSHYADMTLFSTGYAKYVELGQGGFAWLSPRLSEIYQHCLLPYDNLEHDNIVNRFNYSINNKSRFVYKDTDWLDCGKLDSSLDEYFDKIQKKTPKVAKHKRMLNGIYNSIIPENFCLGDKYSDWRFSLRVDNKSAVINAIFNAGLFASSHYASMAGIFDDNVAHVAGKTHSKIVNLFNDHRFTPEQAERVANLVKLVGR